MISRSIKAKLAVFVAITVISLASMFVFYMRGPASLGIGVYHVSLQMRDSGGLYQGAQVSYRSVPVGIVQSLSATRTGALANLRIDQGISIPSDLAAQVRSMSAIGEQYVNLVPSPKAGPAILRDGSVIKAEDVSLPTPSVEVLHNVDKLMTSINSSDLSTTVNELAKAVGNNSEDLGTLVAAASSLQKQANADLEPTMRLLNGLQVLLQQQADAGPKTLSAFAHLNHVAGRLASSDQELRDLLTHTPDALDQVGALSGQLQQPLPSLLAGAATVGNVLSTYRKNIEQVLTILPAETSGFQTAVPPSLINQTIPEARVSFKLSVNNPPECTTGYAEAGHMRDPNDLTPKAPSIGDYCKVPHADPRVVRGARNNPCPNSSARAATPAQCGLSFPLYSVPSTPSALRKVVFFDPTTNTARTADGSSVPISSIALSPGRPTTTLALLTPAGR